VLISSLCVSPPARVPTAFRMQTAVCEPSKTTVYIQNAGRWRAARRSCGRRFHRCGVASGDDGTGQAGEVEIVDDDPQVQILEELAQTREWRTRHE
jgi:hypothetical protein